MNPYQINKFIEDLGKIYPNKPKTMEDQPTQPNKPLEAIIKYCPSCKVQSRFTFRGIQQVSGFNPLVLYDCQKCLTTLSLGTIERYNAMRQTENYRRSRRTRK